MSRVINTSVATVQFQVQTRQASAAMQALQEAAEGLNGAIDDVNRNIAMLGRDVPKDNPQLLNYQSQLNGLKKDLKDVEKAQRDFLKGAKAADQLWKAAGEGSIESLSFRSIKAGINGLKKRQEGLSPGDAQDMKDWRIIKDVIDEADRVMKQAGADVQNVVQTIRDGGKVSEQAMRQTISTLKELKGSVDETDADFRSWGNDLDFMEGKLQEFSAAQRRAKGEIVDANDARREMNKLTEEGAAAARREAEDADRLVQQYKAEGDELARKRGEIKANIEATQQQIDENHKLIEEKHRQLAADEETFNAEQQGRRTTIDGLKTQAEAERKLANEKSDAAETHRRAAELQKQTTEQLTEKVTELQGKLEALNTEPVKPKVDTSEIERLNAELKEAQRVLGNASTFEKLAQAKLEGLRSAYSREESLFNEKRDRLRKFTDSTFELQERKNELQWAIEPFSRRQRQGYNHFDVHDVEQQRVAVEKLDEAFRRLHDDEYFKNASLSRQYELLGTSAFGYSDAERQFGSYERAIRSLGVALEETGAKFRLTFQGAGVDKSFQGVEFLEGYVSRRKELAQINSDIKKALGDTDIDALAREVETEAGILRKSSEELKEQEREVERWGRLKEEYAGKAAEAERLYNEAQAQTTQGTKSETEALKTAADELKRQAAEQRAHLEGVDKEVDKLTQDIQNLDAQIDKLDDEPIKPKVDTSEIDALKTKIDSLKAEKQTLTGKMNDFNFNEDMARGYKSVEDVFKRVYSTFEEIDGLPQITGRMIMGGDGSPFKKSIMKAPFYSKGDIDFDTAYAQKVMEIEHLKESIMDHSAEGFAGDKSFLDSLKKDYDAIRDAVSYGKRLQGVEANMADPVAAQGLERRVQMMEKLKVVYKEMYDLMAQHGRSIAKGFGNDIFEERVEEQAEEKARVEKRLIEIDRELAEAEGKVQQAQQGRTQATDNQKKSVEELEQEIEHLQRLIQDNKQNIEGYQKGYDKNIQLLKEMSIAEEDITNEAKIQEAVEKKTLEIMEAEVNATKEAAEQRRKLTSEITSSQLGGSKAEQTFYAQHKNEYALDQYKDTDEMMDRIAHLEMVSKLKNGKRFSDDTYWDPDDELDDDELYVMTDEEKEAALKELRVLKQHIREELLKTLHLEGDIDNALSEMTGGDGFSEDSKFGQQLNDKIQTIKEKIEEKIETTLDKYSDIIDGQYSSAYGDDGKLSKEGVREEVEEYIKDTIYDAKSYKSSIGEAQSWIEDDQKSIDTKKQLIETTKQQGQTEQDVEQKRQDLLRQKEELQTKLGEQQKEQTRLQGEINQKESDANDLMQKAEQAEQQKTRLQSESNQQSEEELRLKGELETAQGKLAESKQRENDEQQQSVKLQAEAIEQGNKAAEAETKLADAQSEATQAQADFNQKQQEGLDAIGQIAQGNRTLKESIDGLNGELEQNGRDIVDNANKTASAEQQKQQAQQLTIKRMEEMLAVMQKEYREEELTAEQRKEHEQQIKELDEALRLAKGEWMSYGDAMKYASSIGSDGFMATDEQTKMATDALTRHREELIKTIQQKEADSQATSTERAELEQLDQALTKIKTGFASADEVMTRFAEHMNAGKTASEGMAQTLDEKLAGATSSFDEDINQAADNVAEYEKNVQEATDKLNRMEQELAELEQKHANSSWFRRETGAYKREGIRIQTLRDEIEGEDIDVGGSTYNTGQRGYIEDLKRSKQWWQEELEFLKQKKAAELGITEEETADEERRRDSMRLTQEQMQEGIKLLEEEYAKTDHTTEEGIKKRQQLREAIDQMNQEIKESTGEWMSLADAEKLAAQAEQDTFLNKEGTGFTASAQDIQKATQALERQRDALLQTIKAKRDNKNLTNEEKAALDQEEAELQDLTNKLKALKFEQDNFNMSQAKMQELMRTPTNAVSLDELRAAIKRADAELKRMEGSLGKNNDQYKAFAEQVRNAKNMLKDMEGQAKASATAWEKAWSRLKTYVVMYMGFNAVWQKMVGTFGDLMELSDKMGEVRKTTGFTADEVGRLSNNLKRLDVRTSLTQLMEISAKAGQLGLKTEQDVTGFTEAANKLMIALPEMGAEAATEMMKVALATGEVKKIQDQLNQGLIEGSSATEVALSKIGSTIDQLRANSAAAAPQITDFVKRVGAVGAQSGITIDQIAALGATVDAVGLRVEMSATALSRMIPAIRNNAFEVAKAIGMTPNALREMFDEAGGGMEAMLAIFQHIKDSGMDEDSIEKMLGIGNMQDVMKQLNQQGARAGIVFAGLSQNVDELRRNLGVAKEAYEDNIAILQEYNKMNDTAAAKWERFKNQLEEFFVGDFSQRLLGVLIDGLRAVLDLLTGSNGWSAAFRTIVLYLGLVKLNIAGIFSGVKNISFSLKGIAMAIGLIDKETKKLAWGNIFTALAMAALWAWHEITALKSALDKASESLGKTKEEVGRAIDRFEGYWAKIKSTSEALNQAKASHEKLSAEVDKLRKSTDGSAESTANLKKKEDELTNSEKNVTKASNDHKSAIAQMNSIYGKYLGFILTETNYSNLAAAAHDKVTAAIEREMLMKQRQAAIGEVDSNYSDNIATGYGDLNERLVQYGKLSRSEAAKAMSDMQRFMRENLKYDAGTNATVVSKAIMDQLKRNGLDVSKADANEIAGLWFDQYLKENYHLSDKVRRGLTGVERRSDQKEGWSNVYTPFAENLRGGYAETYAQREQARGAVSAVYNVDIADSEGREAAASGKLLSNLEKSARNAKKVILNKNVDEKKRNEAYGELANALEGLDNRINELDPQKDAATINRLNSLATSLKGEGIDIKKLKQAREKIHQTLFERATFNEEDIKNLDTTNPWGGGHDAASTDWKNMTAEQLVARRKQMNEFVNAIQTDSDVQSVLAEDSALKKAIEKGMSSDMRTVIEWYNTERLKIQDELHARHLTNTGDWMDPKKQKAAHKQFQNEVRAYLEELDAYYTERNQEIQTARNNEEITEAEAWRRTVNNETEWYNRRAELQKLYAEKGIEVSREEKDAIYAIIAERTGDEAEFIMQTIAKTIQFAKDIEKTGEKGTAVIRKWRADLGLGWEKDFLKSAKSIGKQMKFIEDTLAKERPYDGITKNLQENLDKMGILAAQYKRINDELTAQGKDAKYSDAEITAATYDEMAFFLKQAEDAWSIDIDELLRRMAQEGMAATAEEISKSEMLKQAVMGQLRKTFEEVQNAVKKEASQIKKDVDIVWNDDTRGPGGMSMKAAYDKAIARLGMQQDSVSRANSLIGAGAASDNVAARLAMKQIEMQMRMEKAQFDMYRVQASQRMTALKREAEEHRRIARQMEQEGNIAEASLENLKAANAERDAENVKKSLGLTLAEETKKEEENITNLLKLQEESQNRLYTSLKEWGDLLTSSVREIMEAEHAGDAEYYNERAKLALTGKGGPGAGTYIIIDDAGTKDAEAHYEYLDESAALERQHEIEIENARAEAWKKVMDDLNQKMSEQLTDWINAQLQNQAVNENTAELRSMQAKLDEEQAKLDVSITATDNNTAALQGLTQKLSEGITVKQDGNMGVGGDGVPNALKMPEESGTQTGYGIPWQQSPAEQSSPQDGWQAPMLLPDVEDAAAYGAPWAAMADASNNATKTVTANNAKMVKSSSSTFAKMTAAANLYGIAYQTMSNDNLSSTQKFEMFALQAAGNAAIGMLTTDMFKQQGENAVQMPGILGKLLGQMPYPAAMATYAIVTALMGGLMGLMVSKVTKSKSQIAQVTGASASAGKLTTGMLTYAEGNVNEFTDPSSLTPGRSYNVDGADGRTYRAKYTGRDAKTHITSGPEFHLVGEKGQEAVIDAHTTQLIRMNDTGIWHDIQTLYNGGSLAAVTRRRRSRGVKAFADGNLDDFEEVGSEPGAGAPAAFDPEMMAAFRSSLDRNNELLERALTKGIKGVFNVYGKGGLVDSYDTGKKTVSRHGEPY